jgi:hypothetical protein
LLVREAAFANALTAQGSANIAPPVEQKLSQTQFVQIMPGCPSRDRAVAFSVRISAVECEIMNGASIDLVESALLALGKISGKLNAAELKYVILQCRFMVCSRTHASIAAYSSGVPTIVIGYSNKSKGIAADLGMDKYCLNASSTDFELLTTTFHKIMEEERAVKEMLRSRIKRSDEIRSDYEMLIGGVW